LAERNATTKARNSRKHEEDNIDLFRVLRGFSSFRGEELASPLQLEHAHRAPWPLSSRTCSRIPASRTRLPLELHGSDVRLREVLRILEEVRHDEVVDAFVGQRREVFGQRRVRAVRDAVLAEVARSKVPRLHLQGTMPWLPASAGHPAATCGAIELPLRDGVTLPRRRAGRGAPLIRPCGSSAAMKHVRLSAGAPFD